MLILLKRLWKHISHRRRVELGFLLCVMLAASFAELISVGLVVPFLGVLTAPELIYDNKNAAPLVAFFGLGKPQDLLLPITLVFVIAVVLASAVRFLQVWLQARIGTGIVTEMAVETYRRTLYQPYERHISRNSSEIISGVLSKVGGGVGATISPLLVFIGSVLIAAMVLAGLMLLNPVVSLFSLLGFCVVYSAVVLLTKKQLAEASTQINQAATDAVKVLQDGLGGIRDVIIDGSQSTYACAYRNIDIKLRDAQANIQIISTTPKFIIESLGIVGIAVVAFWLSKKTGGFVTAIPILGALAIGAQKLLPVMQQAYSSWALVQGAREPLRDVLDLLDEPISLSSKNSERPPKISFVTEIRLEHISFRYTAHSPYALSGICLSLPKGSRIGFIGTTGSGKSTLLDILMGLLLPTEGNLFIDNQALTPDNRRGWQAHIAHVPQAIFLSDATIAENIAFGLSRDHIDMHRVKNAARQAQIADAIESWSDQYETRVGERGVKLSGGQRQRIGIARALYKQADVIIFDEATSALDNETEQAVMQAIEGLGSHLTILIVAHRLTTLRSCTHIVELQHGKLKRIGSYTEIVACRLQT